MFRMSTQSKSTTKMTMTAIKATRRTNIARGHLFKPYAPIVSFLSVVGYSLWSWTSIHRPFWISQQQQQQHQQRNTVLPARRSSVEGFVEQQYGSTDKTPFLRMPLSSSQLISERKSVHVTVLSGQEGSSNTTSVPSRNTRYDEGLLKNEHSTSVYDGRSKHGTISSGMPAEEQTRRSIDGLPVPDELFQKKAKRKMAVYACTDKPINASVQARVFQEDVLGTRPEWCLDQRVISQEQEIYMAAVTHVRLYPETDKPKLDATDLVHWLTYYRYAGVERVYLYDSYQLPHEQFENNTIIAAGIDAGFIEYIDWSNHSTPNTAIFGQIDAYQDAQKRASNARWMIFTDMDEYPYRDVDTEPGFLARFILSLERDQQTSGVAPCERVAQYKMKNVVVHGTRGDVTKGPMLIQQVNRIDSTKDATNLLTKQIVRLDAGLKHIVHTSRIKWGTTQTLNTTELVMKHFWGGRVYDWKRTENLSEAEHGRLFNTTIDNDMSDLPSRILQCF